MSLIQDHIVVTRPQRVLLSVDQNSRVARDYTVVNEVVVEWWIPEGADLVLPPWVDHGVRTEGWSVQRKEAAQVVLDFDPDSASVNWKLIAKELVDAVEEPNQANPDRLGAAVDRFRVAEMFEVPPAEPEAEKTL